MSNGGRLNAWVPRDVEADSSKMFDNGSLIDDLLTG
jgi:hypothetical protein